MVLSLTFTIMSLQDITNEVPTRRFGEIHIPELFLSKDKSADSCQCVQEVGFLRYRCSKKAKYIIKGIKLCGIHKNMIINFNK